VNNQSFCGLTFVRSSERANCFHLTNQRGSSRGSSYLSMTLCFAVRLSPAGGIYIYPLLVEYTFDESFVRQGHAVYSTGSS
jgi:hypothetical protein